MAFGKPQAVLVVFSALFAFYVYSEKQIDHANALRYQSNLLAEELRRSSDDLTHSVRSYVLTGQPIFKQHYLEILDIRDGKRPRPVNYHDIYWDLVLADNQRPRPYGQTVALLELMRQTGFTDEEFAKLAKAKSDALTATLCAFSTCKCRRLSMPAHRLKPHYARRLSTVNSSCIINFKWTAFKTGDDGKRIIERS